MEGEILHVSDELLRAELAVTLGTRDSAPRRL